MSTAAAIPMQVPAYGTVTEILFTNHLLHVTWTVEDKLVLCYGEMATTAASKALSGIIRMPKGTPEPAFSTDPTSYAYKVNYTSGILNNICREDYKSLVRIGKVKHTSYEGFNSDLYHYLVPGALLSLLARKKYKEALAILKTNISALNSLVLFSEDIIMGCEHTVEQYQIGQLHGSIDTPDSLWKNGGKYISGMDTQDLVKVIDGVKIEVRLRTALRELSIPKVHKKALNNLNKVYESTHATQDTPDYPNLLFLTSMFADSRYAMEYIPQRSNVTAYGVMAICMLLIVGSLRRYRFSDFTSVFDKLITYPQLTLFAAIMYNEDFSKDPIVSKALDKQSVLADTYPRSK